MSAKVWMSSVLSNHSIGQSLGTRTKMYGRDWDPASDQVPVATDEELAALRSYTQGFTLPRESFPEADAVFNEPAFERVGELFASAGFFVVRGRLAETLSRFDLGEGGLIPFPIFRADLETPYPGEFFLLNFGCQKSTVLPEQSRNVVKRGVSVKTGRELWKVNSWSEEKDVVVSPDVLAGPDLWFDPAIYNKIFMGDRLVQALTEIGMKDVFRVQECRIAGGDG